MTSPTGGLEVVRTAPASAAQQRLWFAEQLTPGRALYNVPVTLRLHGAFDVRTWRRALACVISRHEVLRTRLAMSQASLLQIVEARPLVQLDVIDLRELSSSSRDAAIEALGAAEARRPFDLARTPLLRTTLLPLAADDWVCLITLHHAICDGWSMSLLTSELRDAYDALAHERRPHLPPLAHQYADYAIAQQAWLESEAAAAERAYWLAQLRGGESAGLRTDRPRPERSAYRAAVCRRQLAATLSAELRRLSRERQQTLFMTLLAAFAVVLARQQDDRDVSVGTFVAGRTSREDERLMGLFVNTLVLRINLEGLLTGEDLFAQVRHICAGAYVHQRLPFDDLVRAIGGTQQRGHQPLCRVLFALHNVPSPDFTGCALDVRPVDLGFDAFAFDLALTVDDQAEALAVELKYQQELFEPATAHRVLQQWELVLEALAIDPAVPLDSIALTTADEYRQVLIDWNETAREYHAPPDLATLLDQQAARSPDAEAIVCAGSRLSYADLHRRVDALVPRLLAAGAGPERVLGVLIDRSIDLVAAILAILKSGAAFLPLTPDLPAARLSRMAETAKATTIVTTSALGAIHPELAAFRPIVIDQDAAPVPDGHASTTPAVDAAHPAYVLYTSGSTGVPKGAINVHGAIVNRLLWMQETFSLTPSDRVLHKTPVTFDVAVWELLWPLTSGATLVLAAPGQHLDFRYLASLIRAEAVTTMHFIPSVLREFLAQADVASCASLRRVICSGEALPADLVQLFQARSAAGLYNLYGPTEAAIDVSSWACRRDDPFTRRIPIGRPIANTRLYVLDDALRPVPVGVAGELYIGGIALARGYADAPGLTAERFVPDPTGLHPGERVYRTGDRATFRADGALDYLGRVDQQLKIHGVRIEPEEIEAALSAHPAVASCVVTILGPADAPELMAHILPRPGEPIDAAGLRRFAEQTLPPYMLPTRYALVQDWPRTSSGKINRKALSSLQTTVLTASRDATPPRTELERDLAKIWRELLDVSEPCVEDNFFELGGHSLFLTRVAARIRDAMGVDVPLRDLFDAPRLGDMADLVLAYHLIQAGEPEADQLIADVQRLH